jgi:hypothetical protein
MTREEAYQAGQAAAHTAPLHDLTTHMREAGIPVVLQGAYLAGIEDALDFDWDAQDEADAARIEQIAEQVIWEMAQ